MEAWQHTFAVRHRVAETARRIESQGFAGLLVADSESLNADVWVEVALAGAATERIAVGPGVTNPVTRHPAVTASAAATMQAEAGGCAVLGLGRGDSALTQIGRRPVPPAELEAALAAIGGLLAGEEVQIDGAACRIRWLPYAGAPKVPVTVAATGPQVIAAAARHADRVDFTVGAEPERLRWAIGVARSAAAGRPLSLGAYLNVAVHPDKPVARDLVRGSTAIFARFATGGGAARRAVRRDAVGHRPGGGGLRRVAPRPGRRAACPGARGRLHRPLRVDRPGGRGDGAPDRARGPRPRPGRRRPGLAGRGPRVGGRDAGAVADDVLPKIARIGS